MRIAALQAARALRRCGAPLRHMARRPRGHVTYARNVMCKTRKSAQDIGNTFASRHRQLARATHIDFLTNYVRYNILYNTEVTNMDAVSYSDLRQKLKSYLDKVYADNDPIIITRKNNENLVLLSMAEYNSLIETNYLMANEANAKHLLKSIRQARTGKASKRELIEK
jgi:antitoxin YefM